MNEFLKKLRSNDKRYDRNRRPYANPQYRGSEKHEGNGWKGATTNVTVDTEKLASVLGDHLPEIKGLLEGLSRSQQRTAEAMERRSAAEERKAGAMEVMAEYLKRLSETSDAAPGITAPRPADPAAARREAPETPAKKKPAEFNRDEIIRLIFKMREEGSTYGEIAEHLESKNVPTFSGKGAWHAQTVHRFYARQ